MRLLLLLLIALAAGRARADSLGTVVASVEDPPREIVDFDVRGKSKLTIRALRYLSHYEEGDAVRRRDIPKIVRALISSELFETVAVTFEDAPGGVMVVATLKDKHSWVVAPTFYFLSGKRSLGVGYAENNFRGNNQKFLMYGQVGERDSLFFGTFLDNNVRGTDLTLRADVYVYKRILDEYVNPVDDPTNDEIARTTESYYLGAGFLLGWNFDWWAIADLRLRGAYVYYQDPHAPDGSALPAPSIDGYDFTSQFRLTLDARHHYFGVTWGPYLQLFAETSIPGLDDYDYSSALLRAYYSWRLFTEHQLELRTNLQVGRHLPIHEELVLGGPIDLRGYALDQFRGDARAMFRVEYSVPITKWKFFAFRAIGFWDTGYIGFQFRDPDGRRNYLEGQANNTSWARNDVGLGLRIYVKRIVLPLLGLDFAYGIEGKAPEVYFQVGLTDF
ncbi:MAG: BamA/TamA family outer membrane protein [Kofleriaceae bacterium]